MYFKLTETNWAGRGVIITEGIGPNPMGYCIRFYTPNPLESAKLRLPFGVDIMVKQV